MSLQEYFQRLEVESSMENMSDLDYLISLHIAHLTHIPFETFDLIDLKQLNIDEEHVFQRLVRDQRGGVCFQQNGLFGSVLKQLGYNIKFVPCWVFNVEQNAYRDVYTHVTLHITLDNGDEYLCDVGFSRDFLTPLNFRLNVIQMCPNCFCRLTKTDDGKFYELERGFLRKGHEYILPDPSSLRTHIVDVNPDDIQWMASYRFPIDFQQNPMNISDFQSVCHTILYSPDVRLNHWSICHKQTVKPEIGAVGILGKKFYRWIVDNGTQEREEISLIDFDQTQLKTLLREKFGLIIDRPIELVP